MCVSVMGGFPEGESIYHHTHMDGCFHFLRTSIKAAENERRTKHPYSLDTTHIEIVVL